MTQHRTVSQRVSDVTRAYEALKESLTPPATRTLIDRMASTPLDDKVDVAAYASLVNASMALARVVAANDRAAMLAAAIITQSGVVRPIIEAEGE